jgi:hypothetical protein
LILLSQEDDVLEWARDNLGARDLVHTSTSSRFPVEAHFETPFVKPVPNERGRQPLHRTDPPTSRTSKTRINKGLPEHRGTHPNDRLLTHNPKVAGSNPAPATKNPQVTRPGGSLLGGLGRRFKRVSNAKSTGPEGRTDAHREAGWTGRT